MTNTFIAGEGFNPKRPPTPQPKRHPTAMESARNFLAKMHYYTSPAHSLANLIELHEDQARREQHEANVMKLRDRDLPYGAWILAQGLPG